MAGLERTPALPEATAVGALTARSGSCPLPIVRLFATLCGPIPVEVETGQILRRSLLPPLHPEPGEFSHGLQGTDPSHDTPDTGVRSATVDQRAEAIHRGMARLLPDSEPRSVDPSKIAFVSLAAVANRAKPLQRTMPSWHIEVQCGAGGRLAHGPLANVRTSVGPTGAAQQLFRLARSPLNLCARPSLTRSNRRGTDPYARWWEGRCREASPYPDPAQIPVIAEGSRRQPVSPARSTSQMARETS
jgi:hypothetical protein